MYRNLSTVGFGFGNKALRLAGSIFLSVSLAQGGQGEPAQTSPRLIPADIAPSSSPQAIPELPKTSGQWHARQGAWFKRNWGVDIIGVKPVSSGYMLAFRYRVLDAEKAKPINEKTAKPYLVDEASGARLGVPDMENVGELRQSVTPEANRTYFIIFGNPGQLVKSGSRIDVVIGNFHVDGLIVD